MNNQKSNSLKTFTVTTYRCVKVSRAGIYLGEEGLAGAGGGGSEYASAGGGAASR